MTTLGSGVDDAVRRTGRSYEVRGMVETLTSYATAEGSGSSSSGTGDDVLNQVQFVYDDFGRLVTEYQEHEGEVDSQTTPKVQYGYSDGSEGHVRSRTRGRRS